MISDETKDDDILDDILDDDFDIDDFDDDWDEQGEDVSDAPAQEAVADQPKQKGILQKFFLPIVIAVVALFVGIFALGQGLLSSSGKSDSINTESESVTLDALPAQNDSVDVTAASPAEDLASNEPPPPPAQEAPLRPLPGSTASQQIELADLEAELAANDADILSTETLEFLDEQPLPETDIQTETLFEEAPELVQAEILEPAVETVETIEAQALDMEDDVLSMAANLTDDLPTAEDMSGTVQDAVEETSIAVTGVTETAPDTSAFDEQITALQSENSELSETLNSNREMIASLNEEISALKATIESLQNTPKTEAAAPIPVSAPEPQKVPEAPKAAEPAEPKAAPKAVAPRWVLKSAQPNKATISARGSNDLKNIEVGSVVAGLGRITNISVENGKWVVRGTKGQLSQ